MESLNNMPRLQIFVILVKSFPMCFVLLNIAHSVGFIAVRIDKFFVFS